PGTQPASGRIARRLLRDLWANYSKVLRPVSDTDQVLNVTLQVTLFQIIDVDERNQELTTYLWTRQVWRDAFCRWNKEDYGGLDNIRVPSSYLWRPDIVLYNSADRFTSPADTNAVVRYDGLVTWDSPAIARTSCQLDVTSFPLDAQRCPLTFGSWTYGGRQLDLWPAGATGLLSDFVGHVEWEVLDLPAGRRLTQYGCCSEPYTDLTFVLVLRRRPAFYLHNLLLPCVLLSALTPLAFQLPAASGEKVSLGVSLLLALTVFQLMVAEITPPAENPPLLGKYYIATMTMMTTSTALTVLIMNIQYCGAEAKPVPRWAKVLILGHMARFLSVYELGERCGRDAESGTQGSLAAGGHRLLGEVEEPSLSEGQEEEEEEPEGVVSPTHSLLAANGEEGQWRFGAGGCPHHWRQLVRDVEVIASRVRRRRKTQRLLAEWRRASRVIDRLFTWIFVLMLTMMSVVITAQAL
ncbi:neuronal acetylcholine receptor subunit alpha-10-like, partial [Mobula hypostoma]|uniref:neuronal acetylcholine receptor subunit alpha-10-like n=1 Tax=Mobula hypostoma TaxID=723540 RepID=UPI002FC338D7